MLASKRIRNNWNRKPSNTIIVQKIIPKAKKKKNSENYGTVLHFCKSL